MAQWLRVHAVLTEGIHLIPSTQIRKLTTALYDRLFLGRCNPHSIHPREGNYEPKVTVGGKDSPVEVLRL